MRGISKAFARQAVLACAAAMLASCGPESGRSVEAEALAVDVLAQPDAPPGDRSACRRWQLCTPANPCHTGWVTGCRAGVPICTDIGGWLPNGSSCGQDQVCYLGECQPCAAGSGCTPEAGPCHLGAIACSTGLPVCQDTGAFASNGTSCGQDMVCYYGSCNWCASGWDCTPYDTCTAWRTDCSSGWQQCLPTTEQRSDGSWCGYDRYCQAGVCDYCYSWQVCALPNPCHTGYTECSTGRAVCADYGYWQPDGTPCGDDNVCQQGACLPPGCTPGADCTPPGQCFTWTIDCSSGAPVCSQTGTPLPNGTSCGEALACMTGQCVSAREVRGTATFTYWTEVGTVATGPRFIYYARALVPDGSGGYATFEGQIQDSSFVIPGVPQGTYLLDVQVQGRGPDLIETSASDIDLGEDRVGRSDAVVPSLSTPVTFEVDGLVPWDAQDRLELVSTGAGDLFPVFGQPPVTSVPEGSVSAAQVYDFASRSQRLIDATRGDEALVVQLASVALPGTDQLYQAASGAGPTPPGFTVQDGVAQTVYVKLEPILEQGNLSADWRIAEFERHSATMNPAAVPSNHRLAVTAQPFAGSTSPVFMMAYPDTPTPTLLYLAVPPGTADLTLAGLAYGHGFLPSIFTEYRSTAFRSRMTYTAPGASSPATVPVYMHRLEPAAGAPQVIVPAISPAREPRLNGVVDAYQPQAGVGETPTLSWTAPEVGTPTSYLVSVYRLVAMDGATTRWWVVTFLTSGTSFQLPPGLLSAGNTYVASIQARDIPGERPDAPYRQASTYSDALTVTGPFQP